MKRTRAPAAVMAACCASLAAQAAPVAYVASDGRDRPARCTQAVPCRTFQAAHDVVDAAARWWRSIPRTTGG